MFLSFEHYLSANLESHLLPTEQAYSYPISSGRMVDGEENRDRTEAFFMAFRTNECNFPHLRTF